jgi:gluconate kinase
MTIALIILALMFAVLIAAILVDARHHMKRAYPPLDDDLMPWIQALGDQYRDNRKTDDPQV